MSAQSTTAVGEAALAAEQSAMPSHGTGRIVAMYIGATGASRIFGAWASVYVHRSNGDLPRGHTGVSAASLARAQRAQVALLVRSVLEAH